MGPVIVDREGFSIFQYFSPFWSSPVILLVASRAARAFVHAKMQRRRARLCDVARGAEEFPFLFGTKKMLWKKKRREEKDDLMGDAPGRPSSCFFFSSRNQKPP